MTKLHLLNTHSKADLLEAYNHECQVRGCLNRATDLHHCVFSRSERWKKWLDDMWWNFQPTCPECNRVTHRADWYDNRMRWLRHQWQFFKQEILHDIANAPQKVRDFSQDYRDVELELLELILEDYRER